MSSMTAAATRYFDAVLAETRTLVRGGASYQAVSAQLQAAQADVDLHMCDRAPKSRAAKSGLSGGELAAVRSALAERIEYLEAAISPY
jgi:hypothetical protein